MKFGWRTSTLPIPECLYAEYLPGGRRDPLTSTTQAPPFHVLIFMRAKLDRDRIARQETPWLIFDLEDSVAPELRIKTRKRLRGLLDDGVFKEKHLAVRINGLDKPEESAADLEVCLHPDIDCLLLPMLLSAEDVEHFDAEVSGWERANGLEEGKIGFLLLLERPGAILNASSIAQASSRTRAICFGQWDYLAEAGGENIDENLAPARAQVVLAARSVGVPAIASPYLDLTDTRGFIRECEKMRSVGFGGTFIIHPRHHSIASRIFSPSASEIQAARKVVATVRESTGVGVLDGKMIGPPMLASAMETLRDAGVSEKQPSEVETRVGRSASYGYDLSTAQVGQIIECPVEVTIDDGWRAMWQASFPSSTRIHSSVEHARSWGLGGAALPYGMLLNLTLCLAVEPFSETCRLHLGLENAAQEAPAQVGDTFRGYVRVDALGNTSRGDACVIRTTHILVNQRGERAFSLTKDSYYDPLPAGTRSSSAKANSDLDRLFENSSGETYRSILQNCSKPPGAPHADLEEGEIILHPPVRPLGISENLLLTTLYRNTHPIHFDTIHFGEGGLIVCGGFVQALVHSTTERELRPVLDEHLERSHHVHPVAPGERIGAISRVLEIKPVGDHLEEVRIHTLGLREVDVAHDLAGVGLPTSLFDPAPLRPSDIQRICRDSCPRLEDSIALRSLRRILRTR